MGDNRFWYADTDDLKGLHVHDWLEVLVYPWMREHFIDPDLALTVSVVGEEVRAIMHYKPMIVVGKTPATYLFRTKLLRNPPPRPE